MKNQQINKHLLKGMDDNDMILARSLLILNINV